MKSRFLVSAIILVLTILFDQLTKKWGMGLSSLHFNQGVILGLYSTLPAGIRIVTLATSAGLVFFIYIILMYLIPSKGRWLKYGLSAVVGGMFGNVIDKIVYGYTIDFIPFRLGGFNSVFNVADVILWIGTGIVIIVIFKHDHLIWHPEGTRGAFLIRPKEQFKVALNLTIIVFSCSLLLGIFSFSFFQTSSLSLELDKAHVMLTYFISYSVLTVFFCLLTFVAGILISHKTAGPLHAFENYVNDLLEGEDRELFLREGDNYKDLEDVAKKLRGHFKKNPDA